MLKKLLQIRSIDALEKEHISMFFDYEHLSKYVLPIAYDKSKQFFYMADDTLGFGWIIGTKPSMGYETLNFLENGIYQDPQIPPNSIIQWVLWGGDFIDSLVNGYRSLKNLENKEIANIVDTYVKFVRDKSHGEIYEDWKIPVRDAWAFLTIKIPFNLSNMSETRYYEKISEISQLRDAIESTLKQAVFNPYRLTINEYLLLSRLFVNPSHALKEATFKYNDRENINKQVVYRDTVLEQYEDDNIFKIDKMYGKVLTVKEYPQEFTSAETNEWLGSIHHINRNQINCRFVVSFSARKATDKEKSVLLQKAEAVLKQQSFSALSTKLQERQEDAVLLGRETEKGQVLWKGMLMFYLYDESKKRVNDSARVLKNMLMVSNVFLQEEMVPVPFFMTILPFNTYSVLTTQQVARAYSMFSYNAAHLTPVQFDWKGSGTPVVPLITRRGQLAFVDLWDTNGGMNACVVGPMGQGKSMFVNHLIFNYRSLPNTKIRVIDVGESYVGISKLFNGQFIKPEFGKPIKVNPFSQIKNLDREMDFLINIVDTMIKPNERCTDTERGMIQVAIRRAYEKYGNDMDINHVKAEIDKIADENKDYGFKKLAHFNLSPWCKGGQYEKFMSGKSDIDLNNDLVVFELGAIKDDTVLTNVLLLSLFYFINIEIYQGDRDTKKLVIWDEAWRFIGNQAVLKFIEQGAREYRKFNGSLVFITQSISDLLRNDVTKVLKNNSEYLFIFWEPPEEWERMVKDKDIFISDYEKEIYRDTLRTVKGKYSEVLVISRSTGRGILRLVLPKELYWIYTTDAKEVALRTKYYNQTGDILKAVQMCIEARERGEI